MSQYLTTRNVCTIRTQCQRDVTYCVIRCCRLADGYRGKRPVGTPLWCPLAWQRARHDLALARTRQWIARH